MTKIDNLRRFLRRQPKGWAVMDRKAKLAAAAKASGMTPGSLVVCLSTKRDVRVAFGMPPKGKKRPAKLVKPRKDQRTTASLPKEVDPVHTALQAINRMGVRDLLIISRHVTRAIVHREKNRR